MSALFWVFVLILTSVMLSKSADVIVIAVTKLARILHISEFNIGFFILGLATTTPEIFIGIISTINGTNELSLGNLLGGYIILLTLIIGLNAIINKEIHFTHSFGREDMLLTSLIIFSPSLFLFDGELSRIDGILLVASFFVYFYLMSQKHTMVEHIRNTFNHHHHWWKIVFFFFTGLSGLLIGSKLIVASAGNLATIFHLPLVLVGVVLLSISTNLPELTVLIKTIGMEHKMLGMGDFLGSAVANTLVMGFLVMAKPIQVTNQSKLLFTIFSLFITLVIFNILCVSGRKLSRKEGIYLVLFYVAFVIGEFIYQP